MNNSQLDDINFWKSITPESTINLKDTQVIAESLKDSSVEGVEYSVISVTEITESDNSAIWVRVLIERGNEELTIIAKQILSGRVEVYATFPIEDYEPGTRLEAIDNGYEFLFKEPENLDHFNLNDLKYANEISVLDVVYTGATIDIYGQSDNIYESYSPVFCQVVEYETKEKITNPYLFIFEEGESDDGGLVNVYLGCLLNPRNIDIFVV